MNRVQCRLLKSVGALRPYEALPPAVIKRHAIFTKTRVTLSHKNYRNIVSLTQNQSFR